MSSFEEFTVALLLSISTSLDNFGERLLCMESTTHAENMVLTAVGASYGLSFRDVLLQANLLISAANAGTTL